MSDVLLRITYLALGIYTFASALITTNTFFSRQNTAPVELFSTGSLWVSFIALVLMVTWASRASGRSPESRLPESFLRTSFLAMGLMFFTCALATTLVLTKANLVPTDIVAVCGLWTGFLIYGAVVTLSQYVKRAVDSSTGGAPAVSA